MELTLTTGAALLQAVIDSPKDTGVRLVYADWLEENDQPERAELIRVQVAIERTACPWCRPDYPCRAGGQCPKAPLRRRERELLGNDVCKRCDWHRPLVHGGQQWEYRRGFIEVVSLTCKDWLAHGPRLVRLAPLQEVRLLDKRPVRYGEAPESIYLMFGLPYWRWFDGSRRGEPDPADADPEEMPLCLWREYARLCERWEHESEADAWYWLNEACLAWARKTEPT